MKRYQVTWWTDIKSDFDGKPYCTWIVREGNGFKYWAHTTCKGGFNPLSKVSKVAHIKDVYEGRYCPLCGRPIKCTGYVFEDDFEEDSND